MTEFETVIGLEVHVELATRSKLFCGCPNRFGEPPNTLVCPVCLGLPGVLPAVNRRAVEMLVMAGRATHCEIAPFSKFDRKNYFYPDMPKNFQTSQYDLPLAVNGWLRIGEKRIGITRIHLEEDTGKSMHMGGTTGRLGDSDWTLVDYNRAGVPLLEIVSEPDMRAPEEAQAYMMALRDILRWIEVSDCKMEQGSLRCDANISLRPVGQKELGTKTEIKNMNSFKSVKLALEYEVERQRQLLLEGKKIVQETRGWDEERGLTISQRSKEEAQDYRYFPEPDLLPMTISREFIATVETQLPELPQQIAARYADIEQIHVLLQDRAQYDFFAKTVEAGAPPREAANWVVNGPLPERPEQLARTIALIQAGTISNKGARTLIEHLRGDKTPEQLVDELNLRQVSDNAAIQAEIQAVIAENPVAVQEYRGGKAKALNVLVGQTMKRTKGRANPELVNRLLVEALNDGTR